MPKQSGAEIAAVEPAIQAYLDALVASLDLPVEERIEAREEIGSHVADVRAELIDAGMGSERASAEALRRLGPPDVLARELTRARHSRRALLAAVGGATWASAEAAARGLVLGIAGASVMVAAGMLLMAGASRLVGDGTWALSDAGWVTLAGGAVVWVSAAFAGRTFVSIVAHRSHRSAGRLRPWVAAIGGTLVGWVSLLWVDAPQNLWSVIALALIPIVFVVAALTASDRPIERSSRARRASHALLATVLITVPLLVLAAAAGVQTRASSVGQGPFSSMADLEHATGFDLPGRYIPDPPAFATVDWKVVQGSAEASLGDAALAAGRWRDLRLEAWRASPSGGEIDRAYSQPFATAPMVVESASLVGALRVDRTRNVSQWWLVVTGVAADGGRDLIARIGGGSSTFTGSAWDWLTAP